MERGADSNNSGSSEKDGSKEKKSPSVERDVNSLSVETDASRSVETDVCLLEDNFQGELDNNKWTTHLPSLPQHKAAVTPQTSGVVLRSRGYLVTAKEFPPNKTKGGIKITGEWTFLGNSDFMQVLTRCSGKSDSSRFGEATDGIMFAAIMEWGPYTGSIIIMQNPSGALLAQCKIGVFSAGETYSFAVYDNGNDLRFEIKEVNRSSTQKGGVVTCSFQRDSPTNHVVIHNRETWGNLKLNRISITALGKSIS